MVSEALKRSFMDFQLSCTSPFPWIWVIETLARSNQVDVPLLLDLVEKSQEISDDLGRNAREMVSLRILERAVVQGVSANSVSPTSSTTIEFNPSESCEDVLRHISLETSASNLKVSGPEMLKWNLEPFIAKKRASLPQFSLQKLKDAIVTGSHPLLASLKKQSGLSVGDRPEHEVPVDDGNCGITQTLEGSATNTQYAAANVQLKPPALTNDNDLLHRDLTNEKLLPAKRNISYTIESAGGKFCDDQIILENGSEAHLKAAKKHKHDIICSDHGLSGNLITSSLDRQLADTSTRIARHSEGHRCNLEKRNLVGCMGKNEPPTDSSNEYTSLKGLVDDNEVLPCENQAPHCDTDVPNNESYGEQGQNHVVEDEKSDKEGIHDLKTTNEFMDRLEQFQKNVPNVGKAEEDDDISLDIDGYDDNRTHIVSKKNASLSLQCTHRQYSLEKSDWREIDQLAGTSRRIGRYSEGERCILRKENHVAGMGQNGPLGDGNNECTSSKGIIGHDKVLLQGKDVPHNGIIVLNDKFDEEQEQYGIEKGDGDKEGILGRLKTTNEDMNTVEQNIQINVSNASEAEKDLDIYSDSEYDEGRTDIAVKKNAFLSSQCTYSQDSLAITDWREQNLCRKCNKDGKLLVCSSNSCPLVVHEGCLGSAASFDTSGSFYCPSCAYSQAILKYQEVMKKFSSARKDLTTFCFSGTSRESKQQPFRSNQLELGECMEKTNEVIHREFEKGGKNHQSKKNLEDEQAEPPVLSSGDNLLLQGKPVHSTSETPHIVDKNNQEEKRMGKDCQSPRVQGQHQMAALAVRKSQGENISCQDPERSDVIEKHMELRSKKGVLCPPKTELSRQCTHSPSTESTDAEEMSGKENESSGASKYFISYRKQERRMRLPWTSAEEETLKEGVQRFFTPHDRNIPWKTIWEYGAGHFQKGRTAMDLKDKWRNINKAPPKS